MVCCRCRVELVQLQWGSALVTALVVVRVSLVGDVVYGPKVKVKPRDQWRSNRRNSNRSNSSRVVSSCSNNRNHSAKLQDSWDAPRRTTVAFVGVAAAVARGITAPIYIYYSPPFPLLLILFFPHFPTISLNIFSTFLSFSSSPSSFPSFFSTVAFPSPSLTLPALYPSKPFLIPALPSLS